jgi:acyl dehydratase
MVDDHAEETKAKGTNFPGIVVSGVLTIAQHYRTVERSSRSVQALSRPAARPGCQTD